jgi:segregation and condensation protein B
VYGRGDKNVKTTITSTTRETGPLPEPLPLPADWSLEVDPPADVITTPEPHPRAAAPAIGSASRLNVRAETPPPPVERIVEALLFVGGPPLTPEAIATAIRGLTPDAAREAIDRLAKQYRSQNRPYTVQPRDGGFVLALRPGFRAVRERVSGGPRQARLSQPALDVLSLVAYKQPITKGEVDAARGADSGGVLRQLVRLGLVAVSRRADAEGRAVGYGTTPRFLTLFGLSSLDDLPRLADIEG